jgi:hypothetical protein
MIKNAANPTKMPKLHERAFMLGREAPTEVDELPASGTDLPNKYIAFLLDHYEMHGLILVLSEKRMGYEMQKHVGKQSTSLDSK